MNILDKIVLIPFDKDQYVSEKTNKTQIVLHHTVSGDSAKAVASYWGKDKPRIATCIIVERDGTPYQLFSSSYWAYHIGVKADTFKEHGLDYVKLEPSSIGVELTNWGGLKKIDGKLFNCYGGEIVEDDSIIYLETPYRGYHYFQKYTAAQIETTKELLLLWNSKYGIPLDYSDSIWDFSLDALKGVPGIYSHTSFRKDKSDLFPQKEMVDMLKSLK